MFAGFGGTVDAWGVWRPDGEVWLLTATEDPTRLGDIFWTSHRGVAAAQASFFEEEWKSPAIPARFMDDGTPHPIDLAAAEAGLKARWAREGE